MPSNDQVPVAGTEQSISKRDLKALMSLVKTQGAKIQDLNEEIKQLRHKLQTQSKTTRMELPLKADGIRQKVHLGDQTIYLQAFTYPDGNLGEIFISMSKEGSLAWGLANGLAKIVSISLQHGVPLTAIIRTFLDLEFSPNGPTGDTEIRGAKSILDYLAKWLKKYYLNRTPEKDLAKQAAQIQSVANVVQDEETVEYPECPICHNKTLRPKAMGCNSVCSTCGHIQAQGCG